MTYIALAIAMILVGGALVDWWLHVPPQFSEHGEPLPHERREWPAPDERPRTMGNPDDDMIA